jgi:hypothetical protein
MKPYSIEPLLEEEGLPKPRWKRRLAWTVGCLIALLLLGWWWVSSEMFLRGVVLDKIEKTLNAEITYESAEWSPRRSVVLRGVRVRAVGQKPCLEARELRAAYHWRDLWAGKMQINEISLVEPVLTVAMDAEGNTNLDPLFNRKKSGGESKPVRIAKFTLQKGTVNFQRQLPGGGEVRVAVTHLEIRGQDLGTQRPGIFTLAAGVQYALSRANSATVDVFNGALSLSTKQELNLKWRPKNLSAQAKLKIKESTGQFAFANGLEVDLVGKYTGLELRQFQIQLKQQEEPAGNFSLSGPVDFSTGSAQFTAVAISVDRGLLNFLGGLWGLDFHGTILNSTNMIMLKNFGRKIQVTGAASAVPLHLSQYRAPFPALDSGHLQYSFSADLNAQTASIKKFSIQATHQRKPILDGKINRPMTFAWGATTVAAPDSKFQLTVMNTDLADWRPWLGRYAKSGAVTGSVKIDVRKAGREISFGSSGKIANLILPVGERVIAAGDFQFTTFGQLTDFKNLVFNDLTASAGDAAKNYFKFKGDAAVDLSHRTLSSQGSFEGELPILLQWFPQKGVHLTAGRVKYDGSFNAAPKTQSFIGTIDLEKINGTIRDKKLNNFAGHAAGKLRVDEGHRLRIDTFKASGELNGQKLLASLDVTGDWNLRTGEANFKRLRVEKLDLAVLQKSVPIPGLNSGQLNADLELLHQPGKATSAKGMLTLEKMQLPPLPPNATVKVTDLDLDLVWREGGKFKTVVRKFNLQLADAGQKPLAHWTGSGGCDPFTGEFNLALEPGEMSHSLLQSLLAKKLGAAKITSGKFSNPKRLEISRDEKGNLRVSGSVTIDNLLITDPVREFPSEVMAARSKLDLGWTKDAADWGFFIKKSTTQIQLANRPSGVVTFSGNFAPANGNSEFELKIADLDHRVLNLLPGSWRHGVQMRAGKIVKLDVRGTVRDHIFMGSLNLDLRGADIVEPGGLLPEGPLDAIHKLEGTFSLGGDMRVIKADVNTGTVMREGKIIGQYDATAAWVGPDIFINLKSLMLGPAFTERAVAKWLPGQRLQAGTLTVKKSELRLAEKGAGRFKGSVTFKDFALAAKDPKEPATPLDASLVIDAIATTNRVFHIRQFTANLPATQKAANQATLSGTLDLSQPRAPTGKVILQSDALDITSLTALLMGGGKSKPTAGTKSPHRFAFRQFKVGLDVKQIHWRDLNATAVRGEVQLDGPVVKLEPVEMLLQGAPVMVDGWISPDGNATKFNLQLSCERLPLTPIARHFDPALNPRFDFGELTLHSHVRADALTGEGFSRTLSIRGIDGESANLILRSAILGRKKKAPPNGQPDPTLLSPVFDVLGAIGIPLGPVDQLAGGLSESLFGTFKIKELDGAHYSELELDLLIENTIGYNRLSAQGPLIGFKTEGDFRLAPNWRDTRLQQSLEVLLVGRLAKKLNITGGILIDNDKHYPINIRASLEGTLAKPKPNLAGFSKFGLGTMRILGKPAEAIERILGLPGGLLRGLFPGGD